MGNFDNELHNYGNVPRELVFDSSLSDRARFVYVFMACKPDGWEFFLDPMSKEIGYSKETLRKYISELIEHGWLRKDGQKMEDGKFGAVRYTLVATKNTVSEKVRVGESPTQDKIIEDEKEIKKKEKALKKKEIIELFEKCWVAYTRKGSKKTALERWMYLSDEERQRAAVHIPFYMKSNERKYLKDFERYISYKAFDSIVFDHDTGQVLFDPDRESGTCGYRPQVGGSLSWNDYYKTYVYTGMFLEQLADGYTDDNRPDGARVMLNNGRGFVVWSVLNKEWRKEV